MAETTATEFRCGQCGYLLNPADRVPCPGCETPCPDCDTIEYTPCPACGANQRD